MEKIATKLKVGTATFALAAATTLVSPPAAQAAPVAPAPTAIGSGLCLFGVGDDCEVGTTFLPGSNLFYLGARDTTPPPRVDFLTFNPAIPLSLIPVLGPIVAGWFATLNFEVCVGGLSARVGPYGRVTASLGSGC
jgi:hypothetical protein